MMLNHKILILTFGLCLLPPEKGVACMGAMFEDSIFTDQAAATIQSYADAENLFIGTVTIRDVQHGLHTVAEADVLENQTDTDKKTPKKLSIVFQETSCGPRVTNDDSGTVAGRLVESNTMYAPLLIPYMFRNDGQEMSTENGIVKINE